MITIAILTSSLLLSTIDPVQATPILAEQIQQHFDSTLLSPQDFRRLTAAFDAIDKKDYRHARNLAERAAPLAATLIEWRLLNTDPAITDTNILRFLNAHDDWPEKTRLHRTLGKILLAQYDITTTLSDRAKKRRAHHIEAALTRYPPDGAAGWIALAHARDDLGKHEAARNAALIAWRQDDLETNHQNALLKRYGANINTAMRWQRLNRLLNLRNFDDARQLAGQINQHAQKFASMRRVLYHSKNRMSSVFKDFITNYERNTSTAIPYHADLYADYIRHLQHQGDYQLAASVLQDYDAHRSDDTTAKSSHLLQQRRILARELIAENQAASAYKIIANHRASKGVGFADAEFLAGFIALRHLNQPARARQHMTRLAKAVSTPISLARAYYWLGRAEEQNGDHQAARKAYRKAARFPATFYGQHAQRNLGTEAARIPPAPADGALQRYLSSTPLRALAVLHRLDRKKYGKLFRKIFLAQLATAKAEQFGTLCSLAAHREEPFLLVRVGKAAARHHHYPPHCSYPHFGTILDKAWPLPLEAELIAAVTRQESEFRSGLRSHAGALGLMQLLPATARQTARKLGLGYHRHRLINDENYNIRLGSNYLKAMLKRFDNDPILALVAYNAGPKRAGQWQIDRPLPRGDTRSDRDLRVDWIEAIPFAETRHYVQRVLESRNYYRANAPPPRPPRLHRLLSPANLKPPPTPPRYIR